MGILSRILACIRSRDTGAEDETLPEAVVNKRDNAQPRCLWRYWAFKDSSRRGNKKLTSRLERWQEDWKKYQGTALKGSQGSVFVLPSGFPSCRNTAPLPLEQLLRLHAEGWPEIRKVPERYLQAARLHAEALAGGSLACLCLCLRHEFKSRTNYPLLSLLPSKEKAKALDFSLNSSTASAWAALSGTAAAFAALSDRLPAHGTGNGQVNARFGQALGFCWSCLDAKISAHS